MSTPIHSADAYLQGSAVSDLLPDQTRPSYNTKHKHTINEFRAPARVTHRVVQAHSSKQALA